MLARGSGVPPRTGRRDEERAHHRRGRRLPRVVESVWRRLVHDRSVSRRTGSSDAPEERQDALLGPPVGARKRKNPGDGLFSRKAALSVSSALESLTSVFGMGTGVASPLESPGFVRVVRVSAAALRAHECAAGAGTRSSTSRRRASRTPRCIPIHDAGPWSALERSSPRPLVRLGCTRRRASTCRLSSR